MDGPSPDAVASSRLMELLDAARSVREKAYAPYSGYAVGAAVQTAGGRVHSGCNVENASLGLTVCAERNAVAAAVAAGLRPGDLEAVALVGGLRDNRDPAADRVPTPCGACLQVLAEFAAPNCIVMRAHASAGGEPEVTTLAELLPQAFRLPG